MGRGVGGPSWSGQTPGLIVYDWLVGIVSLDKLMWGGGGGGGGGGGSTPVS